MLRLYHQPVADLLRLVADRGCFLKQIRHFLSACQDFDIIVRQIKFFFVALHLLRSEFRFFCFDLCKPFIRNNDWCQVRIREVTVILCIFFASHCIRFTLCIIPASCFLYDRLACLDQIDLSCLFTFNGMCDRLKGVQVLHFCTGSEFFLPDFPYGKVDICTHTAFLKFTVGSTEILDQHTKLLQISNDFLCAAHIRL